MAVTFRERPGAEPVDLKAWSTPSSIAPAAAHLDQVPDAVRLPQGDPEATSAGAGCTEELKAEQPRPALPPISVNEIGVMKEIMALYRHITNTKPDKAEPPAPAKSARDEVEGVEVPDDGPRQPAWKFFHDLESYLVTGDPRERELAERMLEVLYETINSIQATIRTRQIDEAEVHMAQAYKMSKTLLRYMANLIAHRSQGVQYFTKIYGPAVGMQAKIENALNPAQNSPEARLVEKAKHLASLFYRVAEHAKSQEWVARDFETSDSNRRWARSIGEPLPEPADVPRWAKLFAMAHAAVAAFDKAAIDFARARRQVMIVDEGPVSERVPARRASRARRVHRRAAA